MKKTYTPIIHCIITIAVVIASYALPSQAATTWHVSTDGTDSAGGTSWTDSFLTISNGLAHAEAGDTVVVSNGTYNIDEQLVVDDAITLIGLNGADVTIVDAGGNDRCCYVAHPSAVVEGLTLRNGNAKFATPAATKGGGVYITNGTVRLCIIRDNKGDNGGGAAIMLEGLLDRCKISNNNSGYGGGIRFENDTVNFNAYTGGNARNCLITQNTASSGGGGAFFQYGGQMDSCTVVDNYAGAYGGGLAALRGNSTWRNTLVYYNTAKADNAPNWYRNNGAAGYNLCTTPTWGTNCQTDEPLLRNLAEGDYRVRAGSPCIDNGQSNEWMVAAVDLDGNSRIDPETGKNDIGAYEYQLPVLGCGFSGTPTDIFFGTPTTFTATVVGTDTNGVVYLWDFDNDGNVDLSGTDKSIVSKEYGIGTHSVSLMVTNASGNRAAQTNLNYVTVSAETTYVSEEGAHIYPYTNWTMAATNIQPAVDVGKAGTTVWVNDGVYHLSEQITVHEGILVRSVNGAEKTTIHGNDSVLCVYLKVDSLVEGMTITHGNGGAHLFYGGTLLDCLIINNNITGNGGGVFSQNGGWIEGCQIISNTCSINGGGILGQYGMTIRNTLIQGNTASNWGGGVYFSKAGGIMENCTVVENTASRGGGIIHNQGGRLWNSIVMNNSANSEANIYMYNVNTVTYTDCCTTPSVDSYGSGNITDDPQFRSVNNFRLKAGSPCINTGSIQTWMTDATDLDGNPRIQGSTVDMGAYEWQPPQGTLIVVQ